MVGDAGVTGARAASARVLSAEQIAAIRAVMAIFVEDDLERGVTAHDRLHCAACGERQPSAGAITYGDQTLCNDCALGYELARARGAVHNAGEFVRGHRRSSRGRPAHTRQ